MALMILKTTTAKTTMMTKASRLAHSGVGSCGVPPAPDVRVLPPAPDAGARVLPSALDASALSSAPSVAVVSALSVVLGEACDAVERPSMNQAALDQDEDPLLLLLLLRLLVW